MTNGHDVGRPQGGVMVNRPRQPSYSGGHTLCRVPLVLDSGDLSFADVVVLGAPVDDSVSTRPGARYGPRAIRHADDTSGDPGQRHHLDLDVNPFETLVVVDHGDVEVVAGDADVNHRAIRAAVLAVLRADAVPIVLGGDHSIVYPNVSAAAEHAEPESIALIQLDAHTDTSDPDEDSRRPALSHGSPLRLLVKEGVVRGSSVTQMGLRGYWPGRADLAWAREQGIRWYTTRDIAARGLSIALDEVVASVGKSQRVWLSVDIDAVDPAYAPGTGTPEPGGLTSLEVLTAVTRLAGDLDLIGMDVVEVCPPYDSAEITAMLAHRIVLDALSGLALRRTREGRKTAIGGDGGIAV